jgi:hypothetical protein
MHPKILAEIDRRAAEQNQTRDQVRETILWAALFPNEPNPRAEKAAKAAFQQSKLAWLEAKNTQAKIAIQKDSEQAKQAKQEERRQAKRDAVAARWQTKFVEAKARWHKKFDGDRN